MTFIHAARSICFIGVLTVLSVCLRGQNTHPSSILREKIALARGAGDFASACLAVGKSFLKQPYRPGLLDAEAHETLHLHFDAFDCWTFVETVLTLVLLAQKESVHHTFEAAAAELLKMRYRNGKMAGYGSRIHYFSEWILQAQQWGRWTDVTAELGGEPFSKTIDFMSKNQQLYPKIRKDTAALSQILAAEARIQQHQWRHIPKMKVPQALKNIRSGDLLAFTSQRPGLDIEHEGFAIWQHGKLHLLHASSDAGRVVISQRPLPEYIMRNRRQAGLIVLRWNATFLESQVEK